VRLASSHGSDGRGRDVTRDDKDLLVIATRVSVVIATYCRREKIAPTLESVRRQSRPADEIIVVDDGSPDDTADWIEAHYPDVIVHRVPNGRTSRARNRGANKATGDVLVFIDHDDEMLPNAIVTLLDLLDTFPRARAAFADHELKNLVDGEHYRNHHGEQPAFERLRRVPPAQTVGGDRCYGLELHRALQSGNLLQQPWAVYRQDFFALGGFDPEIRYCEDWELYLRLTRSRSVALTDRVISIHYVEGGNLHRAAGQNIQHMKVLRKHIRLTPWNDWRSVRVLRRRLANYYKTEGDRRTAARLPGAWWAYVQSLMVWPFDPVVIARSVAWIPKGLKDAMRGSLKGDWNAV
jgi:glycosyltransferase involved in cell wall biosynthesis